MLEAVAAAGEGEGEGEGEARRGDSAARSEAAGLGAPSAWSGPRAASAAYWAMNTGTGEPAQLPAGRAVRFKQCRRGESPASVCDGLFGTVAKERSLKRGVAVGSRPNFRLPACGEARQRPGLVLAEHPGLHARTVYGMAPVLCSYTLQPGC